MKLGIRFADKIVGLFIILAIGILIFVIFMLGSSQRWFSRDYNFKAYFHSAAGISQNMNVQFKGFTIGHIKSVKLADDDRVEVHFTIFDTYIDRVREGSLVDVSVSPIGMGNQFLFYPGLGKELIAEGGIIPTVNSDDGRHFIAVGLAQLPESGDSIGNIIATVNILLSDIQEALAGTDKTTLGRTLGNVETITEGLPHTIDGTVSRLMAQLEPILKNVKEVSDQLAAPDGTVMAILDADGEVYAGLVSSLESVSGILKSLDKTVEFIPPQMPQIGAVIVEVQGVLQTVEDVLISLTNNPLLRKGIPERKETPAGGTRPRDVEF